MGRFSVCVESTVREVNNFLDFHNVHPQVCADVRRRLQRLAQRTHEHVETLTPGYAEPPHEVCGAIVREFVYYTIQHVIPCMELSALEKRSVELVQNIKNLEAELCKREENYNKLNEYFKRYRKAHEFMLHAYFREVFLLRHQLHGSTLRRGILQSQKRRDSLTEGKAGKQHLATKGEKMPDRLEWDNTLRGVSFRKAEGEVSLHNSIGMPQSASQTLHMTEDSFLDSLIVNKTDKNEGLTLSFEKNNVARTVDTIGKKDKSEGECITQDVATQTIRAKNESVDAIFDYEEYIRRLWGHSSKQHALQNQQNRANMTADYDKGHNELMSDSQFVVLPFHSSDDFTLFSRTQTQEFALPSGEISPHTGRAIDTVKVILLKQLNDIKSVVERMLQWHLRDMELLQEEIEVIQTRVNGLLAFLEFYTMKMEDLLAFLSYDDESLNDTNRDTLVADNDAPQMNRTVKGLCNASHSLSILADPSLVMPCREIPGSRNGFQHAEFEYWNEHPIVQRARSVFDAVGIVMRKQNSRFLLQQAKLKKYLNDPFSENLAEINGKGCRGLAKRFGWEDIDSFASLSNEEKLKALVQLRMKRVAYRARHRTRLRRLAEEARLGNKTEKLRRTLREAWFHEQRVEHLTQLIDELLRQLGLSHSTLNEKQSFFLKDLAFSPYLYDVTGKEVHDEMVYVPIPIETEHAEKLCVSLETCSSGYLVFNGEKIPIATMPRWRSKEYYAPHGIEKEGGEGGNAKRKRWPFISHGSVIDYCRGVQMGRALGENHKPLYVFWDPEAGSYFLVREEREIQHSPSLRRASLKKQRQQKQELRQMHLSTILIPPPLPETESSEILLQPHSPVSHVAPPEVVPVHKPHPGHALSEINLLKAFFEPSQQQPRGLLPGLSSVLASHLPCREEVIQPNEETRRLLNVQSLSTQKMSHNSNKVEVTSSNVVTALERRRKEKQQHDYRLQLAEGYESNRRTAIWLSRKSVMQPTDCERFLRLRLPRLCSQSSVELPSRSPSPSAPPHPSE